MAGYLTRVAIAGARTGNGHVRPVRTTPVLPSFVTVPLPGAPLLHDDPLELPVDAPSTAAATSREPAERSPEPPFEGQSEVSVATPTLARLIAPSAGTHRVRMPRGIREAAAPQAAASGRRPPAGEAAEIVPSSQRVRVPRATRETMAVRATDSTRQTAPAQPADAVEIVAPPPSRHIDEAQTEAAADITSRPPADPPRPRARLSPPNPEVFPAPGAEGPRPEVAVTPALRPTPRPSAVPPIAPPTPSIVPRTPAAASAPAAERPRPRVTIGRLELQVLQPPSAPQVVIHDQRPSATAADAIEGRFLDRLRWRL